MCGLEELYNFKCSVRKVNSWQVFYYSKRERLVFEGHRRKIYKQYKYKGVLTVCGMD